MVTLKRITQAEDEAFRKLTALYTEAFPVEERREIGQLGELLHTEPAMYFNAVECDGQLAGLFVIGISEVFITSNIWLFLLKCGIKRSDNRFWIG